MKKKAYRKVQTDFDTYYLHLTEKLGSGACGSVYKGHYYNKDINSEQMIAVKQTIVSIFTKKEDPKLLSAVHQQTILKQLNHKNIVKYIDFVINQNKIYLVMQYCNEGTLDTFLMKQKLSDKEKMQYFMQIIEAFKYIVMKKNIYHRDIKPDNILFHNGEIKVADFGFSKQLQECQNVFKTIVGTPLFCSPQLLEGQNYNVNSDIWSLGLILYYMMYFKPLPLKQRYQQCLPYAGKGQIQLLKQIKAKKQLNFPNQPKISEEIKNLIKRMLIINEKQRMTWKQLFQYPLFKKVQPEFQKIVLNQKKEIIKMQKDMRFTIGIVTDIDQDIKNIEAIQQKIEKTIIMEQNQKNIIIQINHFFSQSQFIFKTSAILAEISTKIQFLSMQMYHKLLYVLSRYCYENILLLKKYISDITFLNYNSNKLKPKFKMYQQRYKICREIIGEQYQKEDTQWLLQEISLQFLEEVKVKLFELLNKQNLNKDQRQLIYLIDNILIIATFQNSMKLEIDNNISLNRFYEERKLISIQFILNRVISCYSHFKLLQ